MNNANLNRLWTWIDNAELDPALKEILIAIHAELEELSSVYNEINE